MAKEEIHERVNAKPPRNRRVKNAIIFLGDGMGVSTITASRILKGQLRFQSGEEESLEFDKFPYSAMIKTYNLDKQVPDSAGTATAYLGGVKANFYTIGVNSRVSKNELDCRLVEECRVPSILEWAQKSGRATGIVSTARITHASPAAAYSHVQNRDFEGNIPDTIDGQTYVWKNRAQCKDIASQLIDLEPGMNFKVILGGGRAQFIPKGSFDPKGQSELDGTLSPVEGKRTDGRNLIDDWQSRHQTAGHRYQYVNNTQGLRSVDIDGTDYLMGLFNHSHMEYDYLRDKGNNGEPSLREMTETAIRMLKKERNGYVLFVEGARIDHAHHDGEANTALSEAVAFDNAIKSAIDMTNVDDTFIVVTADHSHTLTINGYPDRGNPISGFAGKDDNNNLFTTLMYTNGPGYRDGSAQLALIGSQNTADMRFRQASTVPLKVESHHGGEDVGKLLVFLILS